MSQLLMDHAQHIARAAIAAVLPEAAVHRALSAHPVAGPAVVIAIGKAAWRMAHAASQALGSRLRQGVVITKYGHAQGSLEPMEIIEAGHPIPDDNALRGARAAIAAVQGLGPADTVVMLISGGGSALFELPLEGVSLWDIAQVTQQLLASGADIREVNCIRKRLSSVKGGRFAQHCHGARILAIVLSDVIGDTLDTIASGPVHPDPSTREEAQAIVAKYDLDLPPAVKEALTIETPKYLPTVETAITGNVAALCQAGAQAARALGYTPYTLTTTLDCEARAAGAFLAAIAREIRTTGSPFQSPCAVLLGGETVVHVTGNGLGGRNQELALAAALGLEGVDGVCILSAGSDGTDGPTDAAGGVVDGSTCLRLREAGVNPSMALRNNDAYHALGACGGLVMTGATGTNVNDLTVLLVR